MKPRARKLNPRTLYTFSGLVGEEGEHHSVSFGGDVEVIGRGITFESCVFDRSRFVEAEAAKITASVMATSDAANANMERSSWREDDVTESRFTGAKLNNSHLMKVVFRRCKMNLVQMQLCKLRDVRFEECDLQGAHFNRSDLTGTVFVGSNLTAVDFSGAQMEGCDLRRAIIEDIRISPDQLRGVIVTSDQALYLSRLFGLDIQE